MRAAFSVKDTFRLFYVHFFKMSNIKHTPFFPVFTPQKPGPLPELPYITTTQSNIQTINLAVLNAALMRHSIHHQVLSFLPPKHILSSVHNNLLRKVFPNLPYLLQFILNTITKVTGFQNQFHYTLITRSPSPNKRTSTFFHCA